MDKYMTQALNHYKERLDPDTRHKLSILAFKAGFETGEGLTDICRKFRDILINNLK